MGQKRKLCSLNSNSSSERKRQKMCNKDKAFLLEEIQRLQKTIKDLEQRIQDLEAPRIDWSDTYIR
jgi:predicted  nucleic acid-binding Zn-ribbon protein